MKIKHIKKLLLLFFLALGAFFYNTGSSHAANIAVNSFGEAQANDGSCTLHEAIIAVNTSTASGGAAGECLAGNGVNDTIILPAGRIELTSSLPSITESLAVQGQGVLSVIDGNGSAELLRTTTSGLALSFQDFVIVGFERVAIDSQATGDITVRRVQIDGTGATVGGGVLTAIGSGGSDSRLEIQDTYIHDLDGAGGNIVAGVLIANISDTESPLDLIINRTTIARITGSSSVLGIGAVTGFISGGQAGSVNLDIANTTIFDISSTDNTQQSSAAAIAISSLVDDSNTGDNIFNIDLRNNTLVEVDHAAQNAFGITIVAGAVGNEESITVNLNAGNNLISANNGAYDCGAVDITSSYGGAGVVLFNYNSNGGNLTAGSSCSGAFSEPADQNNLSSLAPSLGLLENNGGYVPTLALLEGSPAIDAGVTLSDVNVDARGVGRPQFAAYDSGAYELAEPENVVTNHSEAFLADTGHNLATLVILGISVSMTGLCLLHSRQRMLI